MKYFAAILVGLVTCLFIAPPSESAISCSTVISEVRPCVSYLVSGSGKPPAACCAGVSALASAASTPADKQAACNCIRQASQNMNLKSDLAESLPANCGINLPYSVSPTTDCSKIN